MDDGLTLSRSHREESHTARLIRSASSLFTSFIRYEMPYLEFWLNAASTKSEFHEQKKIRSGNVHLISVV